MRDIDEDLMDLLKERYHSETPYRWAPSKRDEFMVLYSAATHGTISQKVLVSTFGLDLGTDGPKQMRAIKIAISRTLGISIPGIGHADNRTYEFDETQRDTVLHFMELRRSVEVMVFLEMLLELGRTLKS